MAGGWKETLFELLPKPARSLILQIRAYVNKFSGDKADHELDLLALRFLSINSIVDPWVFAILRPPLLRFLRSVLCCQVPATAPASRTAAPAVAKLDLCGR